MMAYQYGGLMPDVLRIDVPEIDTQHERIFLRLEELKSGCFGNDSLPLEEFEALVGILAEHFRDEEQVAASAGVDFIVHAKVHRENLSALCHVLNAVRSGSSDAFSFLRYMEFWFERHIVLYDKPFAELLKHVSFTALPARTRTPAVRHEKSHSLGE